MKRLLFVLLVVLLAGSVPAARRDYWKPNYDKSKIAPYTLEDPLTFVDGRKVSSPSDWVLRRREILGIFAKEMFGREPPAPEAVVVEKMEEGVTLAGFGIRRQYRMWFRADKSGPAIDWLVLLPRWAKKPALPIILLASIAPRKLFVQGFDNQWFDPEGEYLACKAASPAWTFLGKKGLPNVPYPDDYSTVCMGEDLAFVRRTEGHGYSAHDWTWLMDFCDSLKD